MEIALSVVRFLHYSAAIQLFGTAVFETWIASKALSNSLLTLSKRVATFNAWLLLLSAIAWGATILAFAAAGQSVDVQLTIGQAALLASGVALASAIPAGPASLGTFELAAVEIGKAIGVSSSEAFAIGLIAHVSILVVTSIGGVAALAWLNWPRRAGGPETETRTTPQP